MIAANAQTKHAKHLHAPDDKTGKKLKKKGSHDRHGHGGSGDTKDSTPPATAASAAPQVPPRRGSTLVLSAADDSLAPFKTAEPAPAEVLAEARQPDADEGVVRLPDFLDFERVWEKKEATFAEPTGPRRFSLACTIYSISDISDMTQSFRVKYRMLCNVAITEEDFDQHMKLTNKADWTPSFVPNVRTYNSLEDLKKELVISTGGARYTMQVAFAGNGRHRNWAAHYELDCETIFMVPFDVMRCPYDVQQLQMIFQVECTMQDFHIQRHFGEWVWDPPWTTSRWAFTHCPQGDYALDRMWIYLTRKKKKFAGREMDQYQITVLARRNWQYFFWRVMLVLFIIDFITVLSFLFDGFDEMMGFVATMLVAIVAFTLSISEVIPHVSYLTYLDYYVYASYVFVGSIVGELSLERLLVLREHITEDTAGDFRWYMFIANVIFLSFGMILWASVSISAYKKEGQVIKDLLAQLDDSQKASSLDEKAAFLGKE